MDISIGEHAVDYAQIAAKEKLDELQLRVRQLLDQIEQITKEQAYQRVSGSAAIPMLRTKQQVPLSFTWRFRCKMSIVGIHSQVIFYLFRHERRGSGK